MTAASLVYLLYPLFLFLSEENINMLSCGHTHKKNLIVALTPSNTLRVAFRQQSGSESEYLYSQTKIKNNVAYELCIVYEVVQENDEVLFYNAGLYLNGKSETNVSQPTFYPSLLASLTNTTCIPIQFSLNDPIAKPAGNFYLGSESATAMFNGEISHAYFVTRALAEGEIRTLHEEKKINPMDPKNPHAILEETQMLQQQQSQQQQ